MKNLFFLFLLAFSFMSFTSASTSTTESDLSFSNDIENVKIELETISQSETTVMNISFNSFEDFNSFNPEQLNFHEGVCTVSVSVTVSIGVVSVTLTAENIPCSEVGSTVRKLYNAAKQAIQ